MRTTLLVIRIRRSSFVRRPLFPRRSPTSGTWLSRRSVNTSSCYVITRNREPTNAPSIILEVWRKESATRMWASLQFALLAGSSATRAISSSVGRNSMWLFLGRSLIGALISIGGIGLTVESLPQISLQSNSVVVLRISPSRNRNTQGINLLQKIKGSDHRPLLGWNRTYRFHRSHRSSLGNAECECCLGRGSSEIFEGTQGSEEQFCADGASISLRSYGCSQFYHQPSGER